MTERMIRVLIERNREYTRAEEQIGKISALSKLAGNLAHELNNPESAVRSATLALGQHSELVKNDVRYQLGLRLADQTATKPLGGGLGLGLNTVQRVVAKHFGTVSFDTSTQGTTFHVQLPLDRVEIY